MLGNDRIALRTALIYGVAALSWILFSDLALLAEQGRHQVQIISTEIVKGFVFVLLTSAGLYLMLRYQLGKRQRAEAQLQYQSDILRNVSDAIIAVDFAYRIQSWNLGAEATYGWNADEALGQNLGALLKPFYPSSTREAVITAFEQNGTWRGTVIHQRRDGKPVYVVANVSYLKDDDGKNQGIISVNRDVTDQKRLETEVIEKEKLFVALENERKIQEIRTRFMRMVSHEFRTPLTVIQSAHDLLTTYADRLTAEQRQQRLASIAEQVHHLRDLLNEVSLVLNTDSTQPNFDPAEVELVSYFESQIAEIQRSIGETHSLRFIPRCQTAHLSVDAKLMRHVINNLVFNAVKYSPLGSSITFSVAANNGYVALQVVDQGIGIPEPDIERIFEPFYRAANVGRAPGSGLGLAIVKQIVDLHQGTLEVTSRVGEGTTFTVKLPAA
jgi:two-component system sensor histidine kinase VicK